MASAATSGAVVGQATNFPHLIGLNADSRLGANGAPIVFLISDDAAECRSLKSLFAGGDWQLETFDSASDFLARPRPLVPSCLILSASLTGPSGLDLQKRISGVRIETPIIFVTTRQDLRSTVQAIKAGAVEVLTRPFEHEALLSAVREGLERSCIALDREMELRELQECYASLSRRERQVMTLVVSGLLNKQVGGELGISEVTVKAHRAQVMQKMKAESFAALVVMATTLRPARFAHIRSLSQAPVHKEVAL